MAKEELSLILIILSVCPAIVRFDTEEDILRENENFQQDREAYGGEMLGGVVFQRDFEYTSVSSPRQPGSRRVPDLDYTIRLSPEFTNLATELLFPVFQLSGPGNDGRKTTRVRVVSAPIDQN